VSARFTITDAKGRDLGLGSFDDYFACCKVADRTCKVTTGRAVVVIRERGRAVMANYRDGRGWVDLGTGFFARWVDEAKAAGAAKGGAR
jgi:hypothetical protein